MLIFLIGEVRVELAWRALTSTFSCGYQIPDFSCFVIIVMSSASSLIDFCHPIKPICMCTG